MYSKNEYSKILKMIYTAIKTTQAVELILNTSFTLNKSNYSDIISWIEELD